MFATGRLQGLVWVCFHVFALLLLRCHLSLGDVIIGEILHASSYRKRVTLRNTGSEIEALSQYALHVYMNTEAETRYELEPVSSEAVLKPNRTYSICHSRSPESCEVAWGGLRFNGDDYVALLKDGIVVDAVGVDDGEGAGAGGWTVNGVEAATRNHLLIRRDNVTQGNINWMTSAESEWLVMSPDGGAMLPDSNPMFDDACWSVRSRLRDFPLDTCSEPTEKESVIIGTYNTLFLFDGVDDPRLQRVWQNTSAAQQHAHDIADVVRRNAPDILTLAEVEDMNILEDLVNIINDPVYTPYFIQGRDTATGQDMALLTQMDTLRNLTRTNCRSGQVPGSECGASYEGTSGVSKNIIALFDSCLFGRKFALIGLHFYAFPTSSWRCVQRESQARVIQDVIQQLIEAGFEVMVMGDFNDYSDLYEDAQSNEPSSRVLSMLRDPDDDGSDELSNVMEFLPTRERYTAWWDQDEDDDFAGLLETSQIDHILMTEALFSRIQRVWIDHRADPERVSDHWPLFVELVTPPSGGELVA